MNQNTTYTVNTTDKQKKLP